MTDQLAFSLLLGPECFWLVLQKVSRRNRIWREECEVLSIALLLRVPQPCTGRAQKGCFWLAAGCLQAPVSLLWEVAGTEAVAWRHGLLYKDEGEAELVLAVVAAPSWTVLHLQPFASCPWGARPALCLHLPRFSQALCGSAFILPVQKIEISISPSIFEELRFLSPWIIWLALSYAAFAASLLYNCCCSQYSVIQPHSSL